MKLINGIDVHRDSTCSSHMPILMELVNGFSPRTVLETGCGYYSTKLFIDNCDTVVSVESDSDEWFDKMSAVFKSPKWIHFRSKSFEDIQSVINGKWDLIFVDGSELRAEEANYAMMYCDTVIVHDTQHLFRDKFMKPESFYQIDFKQFPISYGSVTGYDERPWTTLFTKREDIYNHFTRTSEQSMYNTYKFPYIYDECPNPNYK